MEADQERRQGPVEQSLVEQSLVEEIGRRLQPLHPERLELIDDSREHAGHGASGAHFRLLLVSRQFEGQSLLARHRQVYDLLGDLMDGPIHALSIRARTPGE